MTVKFGLYPAGRDVSFVRATLDDVRWLMSEHPVYWESRVGSSPFFREERTDIQFRKIFEGHSSPQDWLHLLQPQNISQRLLFVDIDVPGWIALIADSFDYTYLEHMTQGLFCTVAERDNFPPVDDPNGVAQIRIRYNLREPSLDFTAGDGDYLQIELASTTQTSEGVSNGTYVFGQPWYKYLIQAQGLAGYEGLDLPLVAQVPDHARAGYPPYLGNSAEEKFRLGTWSQAAHKNPEASAEFLKLLPFDHRGQDRIVDFFNTTKVAAWLENSYGLRWNDPRFYEGESLLYIVGLPDITRDPFTPRIPLEDYRRFQAIDLERNLTLIENGKF